MVELVCVYKDQCPSWLDQNWVNKITHEIQQQRSQTIQVKLVPVDATVNPIPSPYIEFLNNKIPDDYPGFFMYEKNLSTVESIWGQQVAKPTTIENLIGSYFPP